MKKQDIPWPSWMLRFVGSDASEAFNDLIWSVGGSPPYGGVSYDEAAAVYQLLEGFRGAGQAAPAAYDDVLKFVNGRPQAMDSLEVFRCYDEVTSFPENFSIAPVIAGLKLSEKLDHSGAKATFLAFQSQFEHRNGELQAAAESSIASLKLYLELAEGDKIYEGRINQCAVNTISFTAMAGQMEEARQLYNQLRDFMDDNYAEQLRRSLF